MSDMIEVIGVDKQIGVKLILDGISFSVPRGQFVTVLGPNGAGKTTLLRIVATLMAPSSGRVRIAGDNISDDPVKARTRLGVMSHNTFLYDKLTAHENLAFYGRMYDVTGLDDRVEELLDQVGLTIFSNEMVQNFSRGMQQRLALARATIHKPDILLLDEPYTGLDQQAAALLTRVLSGSKDHNRTVMMITHNFEQGLALSDRLLILNRGRLASDLRSSDVDLDGLREAYYGDPADDRKGGGSE